jgi:hypothetical protein
MWDPGSLLRRCEGAAFSERCFPTSDRFVSQELKRIAVTGDDVFIMYEYQLRETGERYRNAELLTVRRGRIVEAQVFFGGKVVS